MDYDLNGFGLSPSQIEMIKHLQNIMSKGYEEADKAMGPFLQEAQKAQTNAGVAKQEYTDAVAAPDPSLDPGKAGVQRGLSSLAELLSPNKGYAAAGEERNKTNFHGLLRRRAEHLTMLEDAYRQTADRAQKMGDQKLYVESLQKAERVLKTVSDISQQIGGFARQNVEGQQRMKEIRAKFQGDLLLQANKFRADMLEKFGFDTSTMSPAQIAAARQAYAVYDNEAKLAVQHAKSVGDMMGGDPEKGAREAQTMLNLAADKLSATLGGVRVPSQATDPNTVVQGHIKDAIKHNFSLSEFNKKIAEAKDDMGNVDGIPAEQFYSMARSEFDAKEKLWKEAKAIKSRVEGTSVSRTTNAMFPSPATQAANIRLLKRYEAIQRVMKRWDLNLPPIGGSDVRMIRGIDVE